MMKAPLWISIFTLLTLPAAAVDPAQFLYLSDQRIVTIETADEGSIVLNYINLGDSYEILPAHQIVVIDEAGVVLRGHLFRREDTSDPSRVFEVRQMIKPGQFEGYVVAGKFASEQPLARALVQVGGRILELEKLPRRDFEIIAARVGELDLAQRDRKEAILDAGFLRGYGKMVFDGTPEAADLEPYFREEAVLPPVAMATPQPRLPSSEQGLPDPVVVRVQATVTRSGGLRDVQVTEGINPRLDQIALQTVQNSWVFLPAISQNELAEAELKLNVVFKR